MITKLPPNYEYLYPKSNEEGAGGGDANEIFSFFPPPPGRGHTVSRGRGGGPPPLNPGLLATIARQSNRQRWSMDGVTEILEILMQPYNTQLVNS